MTYEAEIDFTTKSVGAMPSVMDTGQAIVTTYNTTVAANPVISNPGAGPRYTIATTLASAQAGYVTTQLVGTATKLLVDFVYTVGIHCWRDPFPSGLLTLGSEGANCHLGFSPTGWIYSVWVDGVGLQTVRTYTYAVARTNTAVQHGEVIIDPSGFATVTGDDGIAVRVPASGVDARINAYTCRYAQCEIYYNNAATEPRTSVSKFSATSTPTPPPAPSLWDVYSTGVGTISCDGHNASIVGDVLSTYEVVARRNFKKAFGDFQHAEVVFQTTPGTLFFIGSGHNDLWLRMTNFSTWATRTGLRMRLSGSGLWTLDWFLNGTPTNLAVASVPVNPPPVAGSTFGFDAGFNGLARRFRATLNGNPFMDTIEAGTVSQYGANYLWRGLGGRSETNVNPGLMRQWTATG